MVSFISDIFSAKVFKTTFANNYCSERKSNGSLIYWIKNNFNLYPTCTKCSEINHVLTSALLLKNTARANRNVHQTRYGIHVKFSSSEILVMSCEHSNGLGNVSIVILAEYLLLTHKRYYNYKYLEGIAYIVLMRDTTIYPYVCLA